jgi:hypothetical protein
VAFLGSTPIGGPLIGWCTSLAGARVGLGIGAVSCFVAAGIGLLAVRRLSSRLTVAQTAALQGSRAA